MPAEIIDEFTRLPLTRQRKWQLRKQKAGLCYQCGRPKLEGLARCNDCEIKAIERYQPKRGRTVSTKRTRALESVAPQNLVD